MTRYREKRNFREPPSGGDRRLKLIRVIIFFFAGVIAFRLFSLQVLSNDFYSALAAGQHDIYKEIFPERGRILMQEVRTSEESPERKTYPLATNQSLYLVYADPRKIKTAEELAKELAEFIYVREKKDDEELTAEEIKTVEKS